MSCLQPFGSQTGCVCWRVVRRVGLATSIGQFGLFSDALKRRGAVTLKETRYK